MVRVYSIPLVIGVATAGIISLSSPCEKNGVAAPEVITSSDIVEVVILDEVEPVQRVEEAPVEYREGCEKTLWKSR